MRVGVRLLQGFRRRGRDHHQGGPSPGMQSVVGTCQARCTLLSKANQILVMRQSLSPPQPFGIQAPKGFMK